MGQESTEKTIRQYIVAEVLNGEDTDDLTSTTPLLSNGILDSMAILKLVIFLENDFSIAVESQEVHPENFDTVEKIATLVQSKLT